MFALFVLAMIAAACGGWGVGHYWGRTRARVFIAMESHPNEILGVFPSMEEAENFSDEVDVYVTGSAKRDAGYAKRNGKMVPYWP